MSTSIRPEISKRHLYFIPKHRFYELRHFCLQYPSWKKKLFELDGYDPKCEHEKKTGGEYWENKVEDLANLRYELSSKMDMIERCAGLSDSELKNYILKAVTEGLSYSNLQTMYDIPCSKDMYYDRFRKFFWILDKERDNYVRVVFTLPYEQK